MDETHIPGFTAGGDAFALLAGEQGPRIFWDAAQQQPNAADQHRGFLSSAEYHLDYEENN